MALVQVFVTGLQMFSDVGHQDLGDPQPRGEDPAFLDTAWTVQVLRGAAAVAGCLALAAPGRPSTRRRCCAASAGGGAERVLILGFASINMLHGEPQPDAGAADDAGTGGQDLGIVVDDRRRR
jgi:hypothetical protein